MWGSHQYRSHSRMVGPLCESGGAANKSSEAGGRLLSEESRAHPHGWMTPRHWRRNSSGTACTLPDVWPGSLRRNEVVTRIITGLSFSETQSRLRVLFRGPLCHSVTPAVLTTVPGTLGLRSGVCPHVPAKVWNLLLSPLNYGQGRRQLGKNDGPVPLTIF